MDDGNRTQLRVSPLQRCGAQLLPLGPQRPDFAAAGHPGLRGAVLVSRTELSFDGTRGCTNSRSA